METLETLKSGKLTDRKAIETYGDHLVSRLKDLLPNKRIAGWINGNDTYLIRKGFANFIAQVNYEDENKYVFVTEKSLRNDFETLVEKLNEESGEKFEVMYA